MIRMGDGRTMADEGRLADATRAVKEERLGNHGVVGMVVEDGLEEGAGDDAPGLRRAARHRRH